jgi:predicted transcriptional regulator
MTVLDRLARRNTVSRRKAGRAFVYAPQISKDSMRRLALKEFVDSFFDGSTDSLKTYLDEPSADSSEFSSVMAEAQLDASLL